MNGAGNDFVLADNRDGALRLTGERIARICDRHRGVGADGLLLVEPAGDGADFTMRYYNSDGGEAEMCGNGARCFARYAAGLSGHPGPLSFRTPAGIIRAELHADGQVTVTMGRPRSLTLGIPVEAAGESWTVHAVNTGVPHAVIEVGDVDMVDVAGVGRAIRRHPRFAPSGTNVNFISRGSTPASVRTYERGVEDETQACGTGVVACAVVRHALHGVESPIGLRVRGGETLTVSFTRRDEESYDDVRLTGPAEFVFEGTIPTG